MSLTRTLPLLLIGTIAHTSVQAGFDINTTTYKTPAPSSNTDGNAKTAQYQRATSNSSIISPEEQRELSKIIHKPINNTGYFRVGGLIGTNTITQMKTYNGVTSPLSESSVESNKNTSGNKVSFDSFEMTLGQKNNKWRTEIQWIHNKALNYSPNPVFSQGPPTYNGQIYNILTSKVNNESFLCNFLRDVELMPFFHPFAGGGIGVSITSVKGNFTDAAGDLAPGSTTVHYNIQPAASLVGGARFRLLDILWLDVGYRYSYLGMGGHWNFQPAGQPALLSIKGGGYINSGITAGLSYQF
jgi:opacity protein-like surface antigen